MWRQNNTNITKLFNNTIKPIIMIGKIFKVVFFFFALSISYISYATEETYSVRKSSGDIAIGFKF